jgi:hypothetical protein
MFANFLLTLDLVHALFYPYQMNISAYFENCRQSKEKKCTMQMMM